MTWQSCEFYRCVNGACTSEILVLRAPRTETLPMHPPRCVCGQPLQKMDYGPQDPLRTWTFS